ncbi:GerAB/ArcD/ProY family transporter [Paenibacillus qinlingensis]|uniref:GerAB/ArcD/ProY family transporter n=1 Tax=Paenibacillus qinlingensis TaxID=1837343 RepID=UPI0015676DF2|nr:endospore germination permease [Paenibacillus qinlingensis]NQX60572.1 endospore germination permease [Paenibacillus qinlingensis]
MEKISERQLVLIGSVYTFASTILHMNCQVVGYAERQVWLAGLLAAGAVSVSIWLIAGVMSRFPGQDLFQVLIGRFPIWGRTISMLYILFFFFIFTIDLRTVVDMMNILWLPRTPETVIALLVVITTIVIVRGGGEVVGRLTELFGPLNIIVIFSLPFLIFVDFHMSYIRPVFDTEFMEVLKGSWIYYGSMGHIIAMPFLCSGHTFRFRHGMLSLSIAGLVIIVLSMNELIVLGAPVMSRSLFCSYELIRQVQLTDLMDRFEIPLVSVWVPVMLIKTSYSLYMVCHGLRRLTPHISGQLSVAPVGLFALACSLWFFQNYIQLLNFNKTMPMISILFELMLPLLLYFILKPPKRPLSAT